MTSTEPEQAPVRQGWLRTFGIYRHPRVMAMLFLGFSSGLPFALVAGTLAAWLTQAGVSMTDVGMFAWVGVFYAFKFFWAPLVDQLRIPLLTRLLGRRRSWMLLAQVGVAAALVGMAGVNPTTQLSAMAWLAVMVAFSSATQDIAVDAWRIEAAELELQGAMAASYQLGYRIALLAAGAGALAIGDSLSWSLAYQLMAVLMGVGMFAVLMIAEPKVSAGLVAGTPSPLENPPAWFYEAVVQPFTEFFHRNGSQAIVILLLIGIYRISDMVLGVMANPFYLDIGFTGLQIAGYAKTVGLGAVLTGAAIGGAAVARYGLGGPLVFGAAILAITNLGFAVLAVAGDSISLLILTICADNLAQGFTGTVFIAYLSSLTSISYTATQYALFTSIMVLPGKLLSGFSGAVVDAVGWVSFFVYASLMGVPAIFLTILISRWLVKPNQDI